MSEMKWRRLKGGQCPKCASILNKARGGHECPKEGCDFYISSTKFDSMVDKMYREDASRRIGPAEEEEARLSEINNMQL